jgi:hypothetical protein
MKGSFGGSAFCTVRIGLCVGWHRVSRQGTVTGFRQIIGQFKRLCFFQLQQQLRIGQSKTTKATHNVTPFAQSSHTIARTAFHAA